MNEHNMKIVTERDEIVAGIVNRIVMCADANSIVEIYAKNGSQIGSKFGKWVGLMVVVDEKFKDASLTDLTIAIEEEHYNFNLSISLEPNDMERGHGTVLYKRR